ncbi:MAG: hypothetical protein ACRCST_05405 [Turicibacter sp.]
MWNQINLLKKTKLVDYIATPITTDDDGQVFQAQYTAIDGTTDTITL